MTGIAWKLQRLRAMSPQEVLYRGARWLTQQNERLAVVSARAAPKPERAVTARCSLFSANDGWREQWLMRYRIDQDGLDDLLKGRIDLFGNSPIDTGFPTDWHRDPTTGITAPLVFGKQLDYRDPERVGNVKVIWELGRHQHLIPLAVAYAVTGETRYRDGVARAIESWIEANPYATGIHWTSALECALRLISWSVIHSLLALRDGRQALFDAVGAPERLGLSIYQQAKFVSGFLSRYSSANNHLIGELTGLWVVTQVFDLGNAGIRWARLAKARLQREAEAQIHGDGVSKEQAFYYHLWVLEYLLVAYLAGVRSGVSFSARFRDRIVTMAGFLRDVSPAHGRPPAMGDSDDGFVARFEPRWPMDPYGDLLSAVAAIFRFSWERQAETPPEKAFWYRLMAGRPFTDTQHDESPGHRYPILYPQGGYAILGGGGLHLVFDAGPLGYPSIAAHGHADALSFCLAIDGDWWLVDPGTYAYHDERVWRDYFRGSRAHNTLVAEQRDQSESGGPFLWLNHASAEISGFGTEAGGRQWVEGSHDGYRRVGLNHSRRILLDPHACTVDVEDVVKSVSERELEIFFHLHARIEVAHLPSEGCWAATREGSTLRLRFELDPGWQWAVVKGQDMPPLGWYSPRLGCKLPACTLVGRRRLKGEAAVTTRITLQRQPGR